MQHPGCARRSAERQLYSDGFRHFIVALRAQHEPVALDVFATLVEVPLGTLKTWLSPSSVSATPPPEPVGATASDPTDSDEPNATLAQIETVLVAWKSWDGTFIDFADHVRTNLRVPFGRHLVAGILEQNGARLVRRRSGRSPDEIALRGAFETFFSGAQWVGDGKKITVTLGSQSFDFNLELDVDAYSDACVGLCIRDTEDSTAVVESFDDGVSTTGAAPLALLLDNRPSNHTAQVDAALGPSGTLRMRATLGRPQNKAHVEGGFGLFSQTVPPITINTSLAPREVARQLAVLVSTTFARATNRRARADRGGRSRVDLYAESPTDDQIAVARHALAERCRRQELARATLAARERPEVRDLLDAEFEKLGLSDPERNVRLAIAGHTVEAITDGISIFGSKRRAGTLPKNVDARYLLGIVRNVDAQREGEYLAEALLEMRLKVRDRALAGLTAQQSVVSTSTRDASDVITDCVDRALATDKTLDRLFWLTVLANEIQARAADLDELKRLYFTATRRINTTFRVSPRERQNAMRILVDHVVPLS